MSDILVLCKTCFDKIPFDCEVLITPGIIGNWQCSICKRHFFSDAEYYHIRREVFLRVIKDNPDAFAPYARYSRLAKRLVNKSWDDRIEEKIDRIEKRLNQLFDYLLIELGADEEEKREYRNTDV